MSKLPPSANRTRSSPAGQLDRAQPPAVQRQPCCRGVHTQSETVRIRDLLPASKSPSIGNSARSIVPSAVIHRGNPTFLFPFMAKPSYLHTNTNYVAAD